jgi:hypothetical protein
MPCPSAIGGVAHHMFSPKKATRGTAGRTVRNAQMFSPLTNPNRQEGENIAHWRSIDPCCAIVLPPSRLVSRGIVRYRTCCQTCMLLRRRSQSDCCGSDRPTSRSKRLLGLGALSRVARNAGDSKLQKAAVLLHAFAPLRRTEYLTLLSVFEVQERGCVQQRLSLQNQLAAHGRRRQYRHGPDKGVAVHHYTRRICTSQ